ncbi:hypothetical protein BRC97_00145 [Halobacteriales archaeon QS_6_71_20]|nr:MAG: hypothetical protein BRC97_00145 [Halobacteriales archaeon QS_6_71_20]
MCLSLVLLMGEYLFGMYMQSSSTTNLIDGRLPIVVVIVVVIFGAVAAGNAYWNDGIVLSWLLVFGPVCGLLWPLFVQKWTVFLEEAILPFGWSLLAAAVVGTLGYVIGRYLRFRGTADTAQDSSSRLLRLFVGRDTDLRRWVAGAGGTFVAVGVGTSLIEPGSLVIAENVSLDEFLLPVGALDASPPIAATIVGIWIAVAAVPAYRNEGVLVSWLVTFSPFLGGALSTFVTSEISGAGPLMDATLAFLTALMLGCIIGTTGFVVGRGLCRVIRNREFGGERRVGS